MVCILVIARFCAPSSECLFYDITSTCFEGNVKGNHQAQRGYSRDKRSDCPQVCTGLLRTCWTEADPKTLWSTYIQ
jgi:transposase